MQERDEILPIDISVVDFSIIPKECSGVLVLFTVLLLIELYSYWEHGIFFQLCGRYEFY